jgi:S1-C subfamily serine protease
VKSILCPAVIVLAAATAFAQLPPTLETQWTGVPAPHEPVQQPAQQPHPAVARIVVPNRGGVYSLGSGTLVAVTEQHGLVVTNWHVVEGASGPIVVIFPNGFRTGASLLRTDKDWDLAALAVWRPGAVPVPLSNQAPRPGEKLTIAGYGSGNYRAISGKCTGYVAPDRDQPFEMVELAAPARQGDSGGPILNTRGELAGVLFGTGGGQTTGSYCGRVRAFLTPAVEQFQRMSPAAIQIAQQSPAEDADGGQVQYPLVSSSSAAQSPPAIGPRPGKPLVPIASGQNAAWPPRVPASVGVNQPTDNGATANTASPWRPASPPAPGAPNAMGPSGGPNPAVPASLPAAPPSDEGGIWDVGRNLFAIVGVVAILFHAARFLAPAERVPAKKRKVVVEEGDEDDE